MTTQKGQFQGLSSSHEAPFVATLRAVRQREAQLANARAKLAEIRSYVEDIRFALSEIAGVEDYSDESLPLEARVILAQVNSFASAMAAAATIQRRN